MGRGRPGISAALACVLSALAGCSAERPAREPDVIFQATPRDVVDKMLAVAWATPLDRQR